jgi:hypothetical protein
VALWHYGQGGEALNKWEAVVRAIRKELGEEEQDE